MFTGIIQDVGQVSSVEDRGRLVSVVIKSELSRRMSLGGSISVNGTCLTAVALEDNLITVEIGPESLDRTSMADIASGDRVNLELPTTATSMLDGHIVQGHVDGVGRIASVVPEGESFRVRLETSPGILRYLVEKGSITVDGISLTVAALDDRGFEVSIIPHTLAVTTLGLREVGQRVNLEVDVIAKYVERLLKN